MITEHVQRWRSGRAFYRPARETVDARRFDVVPVDENTARGFVVAHHYSRSYPAARVRLGLLEAGALVGVAVFSQPLRDAVLRELPGSTLEGLELGRFVLLDSVGANAETLFLARCFVHLRAAGFRGVVSFSDPEPRTDGAGVRLFGGHVGTIYQAHNATFLGRAHADTVLLLPDGTTLHRRGLSKLRARDQGWRYVADRVVEAGVTAPTSDDLGGWIADRVEAGQIRKRRHPGTLKYAWTLHRADRRHLPPSLPYPKFSRTAGVS